MGMIINPYLVQPSVPPFTGILDTYSGATVAYSLRKLSSTYTGNAIRVRRSSDNTEENIGFDSNGNLDTTALTTFVGANNGFVTTWYDQSGLSRNTIQQTASQQPQIVTSGVVNTLNNKPALRFNNNHYLYVNSTSVLNIQDCISTFSIANFVNNGGFYGFIMSKGYGTDGAYGFGQFAYGNSYGGVLQLWIESNNIVFQYNNNYNTQYLFSNTNAIGSNGIKLYKNGTLHDQLTTTNDLTGTNGYKFNIGRNDRDTGYYLDGNIQEIICYPTYLESSRTSIESNINTFYSIY